LQVVLRGRAAAAARDDVVELEVAVRAAFPTSALDKILDAVCRTARTPFPDVAASWVKTTRIPALGQ
jgi:hypothetical protein